MSGANWSPAALATLDQDWMEAVDWFSESNWSAGNLDYFTSLFVMDPVELVEKASPQDLDHLQRLARIAFFEAWKRSRERNGDGLEPA